MMATAIHGDHIEFGKADGCGRRREIQGVDERGDRDSRCDDEPAANPDGPVRRFIKCPRSRHAPQGEKPAQVSTRPRCTERETSLC